MKCAAPGCDYYGMDNCPHQLRVEAWVGGRKFISGATRDTEAGKLDYEGFLNPRVLEEFAKYMDRHRKMADGSVRDSDNWQNGMPRKVYLKSLLRHSQDVWLLMRGYPAREDLLTALMAIIFNAQGLALEVLEGREL